MSSTSYSFVPRYSRWLRTSRKQPCPICGRAGWCELSQDGTLAHCMRSTTGGRPIQSRGGGRLFELRPTPSSTLPGKNRGRPDPVYYGASTRHHEMATDQTSEGEHDRLDLVEVDKVFRALLERCPLSEHHRRYLERAGVPITADLGTLWANRAHQLGWQLVTQFGEEIAVCHPLLLHKTFANSKLGLIPPSGRDREPTISCRPIPSRLSYWTLAGAGDGLLFGATNYQGLITGIQIRYDWPRNPSQRYRWLSGPGKGGTPLTVFRATPPGNTDRNIQAEELPGELLVITEGYKKAAAFNQAWGSPAISLAGVSAYHLEELLSTVATLGVKRIAVAFDQDKRAKAAVQQAEARILRLLAAHLPELELYLLEWDSSFGKGLDDALRLGVSLKCVAVTTIVHQPQNQKAQILPLEGKPNYNSSAQAQTSNTSAALTEANCQTRWEALRQAQPANQRYNQLRQK